MGIAGLTPPTHVRPTRQGTRLARPTSWTQGAPYSVRAVCRTVLVYSTAGVADVWPRVVVPDAGVTSHPGRPTCTAGRVIVLLVSLAWPAWGTYGTSPKVRAARLTDLLPSYKAVGL